MTTYHTHNCGGQIEISNRVRVRCQRCGFSSHVRYFGFRCSSHRGDDRYATSQSLSDALFLSFNDNTISRSILMEILNELRTNPWY